MEMRNGDWNGDEKWRRENLLREGDEKWRAETEPGNGNEKWLLEMETRRVDLNADNEG